ncbi:hypothetical protein BGX28_008907 [Mortierella sp. GBA30]|nr:hypothetical protein BGX28_008907 [Mortierella sp. GBA30]
MGAIWMCEDDAETEDKEMWDEVQIPISRKDKDKVKALTPSEIIKETARGVNWKVADSSIPQAVRTFDSKSTQERQRAEARDLASDAMSTHMITNYFQSPAIAHAPKPDAIPAPSLSTKLSSLKIYLKETKGLTDQTRRRIEDMIFYLQRVREGDLPAEAAKAVRLYRCPGPHYARTVRESAERYISESYIPSFTQGKHAKIQSLLSEEDFVLEVREYLLANNFSRTPQLF